MAKRAENIINRNVEGGLEKELSILYEGLSQAVDFGAQILEWDLNRNGTDVDLPALLFLRNLLENIDAIGVLVKNSIVEPCNSLLRTALENFFSIEYLLIDPGQTNNRAMSFLVWNFVVHQKWLKKGDITSKEFKDVEAKFKKDRLLKVSPLTFIEDAKAHYERGELIFSLPVYKDIKQEYDRTSTIRKNPAWYSLFNGPNSLEEMANKLGFPAFYEVLYRGWSPSTHGNNIIQGKISLHVDGTAEIAQLRDPYGASSIIQHCMNICILTFKTYINNRMPQHIDSYNNWYASIREFNLSLVSHRSGKKGAKIDGCL